MDAGRLKPALTLRKMLCKALVQWTGRSALSRTRIDCGRNDERKNAIRIVLLRMASVMKAVASTWRLLWVQPQASVYAVFTVV